jgi:hypothetical protein
VHKAVYPDRALSDRGNGQGQRHYSRLAHGMITLTVSRLHESACRTNGGKTHSTPIFATVGPEEPQILRPWSSERGSTDHSHRTGYAEVTSR